LFVAQQHDVPIWREEFAGATGSAPNPAIWSYELGAGGWGCDQNQTYTSSIGNAQVTAEGHLGITATRCAAGAITSARLITKHHFTLRYGRIEARIKVPGGLGTWPAFWMLGSSIDEVGWPDCGEIDVMEHVGSDPRAVHGTLHGPGYSGLDGGIGRSYDTGVDLSEDFHIYGVHWTADQISWLLDGEVYQVLTPAQVPGGRWPFNSSAFYLLLNLAIGGAWPGNATDDPQLPATMLIDWIRVSPIQPQTAG
jgi:beta-glucanase (GH16 family)